MRYPQSIPPELPNGATEHRLGVPLVAGRAKWNIRARAIEVSRPRPRNGPPETRSPASFPWSCAPVRVIREQKQRFGPVRQTSNRADPIGPLADVQCGRASARGARVRPLRAVRDIELPVSGTKAEVLAHSASPAGVSVTLSSNYEVRKKRGLFSTSSSRLPSPVLRLHPPPSLPLSLPRAIIRRCEGDPRRKLGEPRDARARGGGEARPSSRGEVFQARDFQREAKATRSPLSSARTFPGPLCTTTYIDRESGAGRQDGAEARERVARGGAARGWGGGGERVYGRVRYTGARTKKETSALSSTIAHGGHVAVSSARCDYVRLGLPMSPLSLSLSLSLLVRSCSLCLQSSSNAFPGANTRRRHTSWPFCLHRARKDVARTSPSPPSLPPPRFSSLPLSLSSSYPGGCTAPPRGGRGLLSTGEMEDSATQPQMSCTRSAIPVDRHRPEVRYVSMLN